MLLGLSLLCSKICLLCFLAFPQFSANYACFMLFRNALCFYFVFFSLYRNFIHVIQFNGEVSCAPEFIGILEQGIWGMSIVPKKLYTFYCLIYLQFCMQIKLVFKGQQLLSILCNLHLQHHAKNILAS